MAHKQQEDESAKTEATRPLLRQPHCHADAFRSQALFSTGSDVDRLGNERLAAAAADSNSPYNMGVRGWTGSDEITASDGLFVSTERLENDETDDGHQTDQESVADECLRVDDSVTSCQFRGRNCTHRRNGHRRYDEERDDDDVTVVVCTRKRN